MKPILINNLPEEERPREHFIKYGKENISNEDLISIILRTGTKNQSVKELSKNILTKIDDITDLKELTINKLKEIKGIGNAKAITLLASIELGYRVHQIKNNKRQKPIHNPEDIYNLFKPRLKDKKQEHFYVVFLNNKKELIDYKLLFKGSLNISIVHPREIFKEALKYSAASIICVHNHPSGDERPSLQDITITKRIKTVSETMGIPLEDHVIIGDNYYSFSENNQ